MVNMVWSCHTSRLAWDSFVGLGNTFLINIDLQFHVKETPFIYYKASVNFMFHVRINLRIELPQNASLVLTRHLHTNRTTHFF